MPTYTYTCSRCGKERDEVRTIADRNLPCYCMCVAGGSIMTRAEVYNVSIPPNEASHWPYVSQALVPSDERLKAKYAREGRLTEDGGVRIESPADYARVCKEQKVKPVGDYEVISKSRTRPYVAKRGEVKRERRVRERERVKKKLAEKGVSLE